MTEKQFNEISVWQKETFGQATAVSKIMHLKKEIEELMIEIAINGSEKRLEFADCFFLLFGAAAADGMSYQDICEAIDEKFEINKARKWRKPDKNGIVEHISQIPTHNYHNGITVSIIDVIWQERNTFIKINKLHPDKVEIHPIHKSTIDGFSQKIVGFVIRDPHKDKQMIYGMDLVYNESLSTTDVICSKCI